MLKGLIGFIGVISFLSGLYNLVNGYYIYSESTTIMQQNMGVNTSMVGMVGILIFIVSIVGVLLIEKE